MYGIQNPGTLLEQYEDEDISWGGDNRDCRQSHKEINYSRMDTCKVTCPNNQRSYVGFWKNSLIRSVETGTE